MLSSQNAFGILSLPAVVGFSCWLCEPTGAEGNRVLREPLRGRRAALNDDRRRLLAVRAKKLGWRLLQGRTTLVTPATLLGLASQADRPEV